MKKQLLFILAFAYALTVHAQVPQTPLVEHFTQASCTPCASQNPLLKTTLDSFGELNYVRISHQTSWPGVDPMNAQFGPGPDVRRNYYGVTGVPNTTLNGGPVGAPNSVVTSATLSAAANNTTPYDITATQTWLSPNQVSVNIDVANVTGGTISSADKIYVAMIENVINYAVAPGSNGETSFHYVMRQMYNASTGSANATGGASLGPISASNTTNFNFSISNLPTYIRDKTEISFAVYIQNNGTKQIFQSAKTVAAPIPGLISVNAVSTSIAGNGYCDYSLTPRILFSNADPTAVVTSVVAQYSIDGGTPVQQTFTGSLVNRQSATITFPMTTLNSGVSVVSSEILSVNGGQNWASPAAVGIDDQVYSKLNALGVATPFSEGMENAPLITGSGYSRELTTAIFDVEASVTVPLFSIIDGPAFGLGAVGGFANSNRSLFFRYYNAPSGAAMNLIMQKVNLGTNSTLTFSHAHRQYQTSNDRLEVFVSTDCGVSWVSVFNQAGATLSTLGAANAAYIPAASSDWRSNSIDLSAYDGTNEVVIRFTGTSDYGNNLFIDDIDIQSTLSVDDANEMDSLKIFPNPASGFIQISGLNTFQNYEIYNLLGARITYGGLENNQTIDIKEFANGLYLLKLENGRTFKFMKE
jgi:hypothetical protein